MSDRESIVQAIADLGQLSSQDAERVLVYYQQIRVIKFSAHDGFAVSWGGFLDKDVLQRAAQSAKESA
jgi:hypothetical protein